MSWTNEANLVGRLMKAERELTLANQALIELRGQVVSNLINPGNEDETLEGVIETITSIVGDGYVYDYEVEYDAELSLHEQEGES